MLTKDWLESPDAVLQSIERQLAGEIATAAPAAAPIGGDWSRRLVLASGAAAKFWEIEVAGVQHTVRFGQVGAKPQTKTKTFADHAAADSAARRLVEEKLSKGYVDAK